MKTVIKNLSYVVSGIIVVYAGFMHFYYTPSSISPQESEEEMQKSFEFEMFNHSVHETLKKGCDEELHSICKDNFGTAALGCIKDYKDKISPTCKKTMDDLNLRIPANN